MKEKHYSRRHIVLAVLAGFLATLLLFTAALWALVGTEGMSLLGAWGIVKLRFVGDYEADTALDSSLNGLVTGLGDRWSYYVNAEGYKNLMENRSNSYVGIGVTVSYDDERGLLILSVREDGPAYKAGLAVGEVITAVDGTSIAGEARYNGSDGIRGEAGTDVVLTVIGTDGTEREVTATRAAVYTAPVSYEMLPGGIGYVDLGNFNTGSSDAFIAAVDDLVSQGAVGFVFDMRNNGGGYVTELTAMLDHLLPEGDIFRSTTKGGRERVTRSDADCINLPMVTLVNANTYSAAEFFAAQLKESVGAPVVGVETSGKGYSQQTLALPNGGALNISTGKYTTGAGVSLIGTGVALDVEVDLSEEQAQAFAAGTLDHADDPQLQAALELLK